MTTPNQAQNTQDPWDNIVIGLARLWGYRRETLLIAALTVVLFTQILPVILLVAVLVALARRPLGQWLHTSRVRRQWARAVISAGAADPPPKRSRKAQAMMGPKVKSVRTTAVGDELIVRVGRGRGTVDSLTQHSKQLAADLDHWYSHVQEDGVRVAAIPKHASLARVVIARRDPFHARAPIPWPNRKADQLSMWDPIPIGVAEDGDPVYTSLVEKNLLIGGEPGAGKSAVLSLIAATAVLDNDCRLYLLDGKQVELAPWKLYAEACIGPNIVEANALLKHLRNVLEARYLELLDIAEREDTVIRKVRRGMPLHVLICDELVFYTQAADRKQRGIFNEQLRDLIARGRAAGIIVIAATQKPSADVVPSFIRDIVQLRLALRCTTPEASDTILGRGAASAGADASTIEIGHPEKNPGPLGVGYLLAEGSKPVREKAFYLTDMDIADVAARATTVRAEDELQAMLADAAVTVPAAPRTNRPAEPNSPPPPPPSRPDEVTRCLPLEGEGLTRAEWAALAGRRQWKYLADDAAVLLERGVVVQTGAGVRGSPFRYRLAVPDGEPRATDSD